MPPAIRVENLSKRYTLGLTHAGSIRELASRATTRLFGRKTAPKGDHRLRQLRGSAICSGDSSSPGGDFWALKDVSFEVQPGEVLGIIGRNGAGKSTLLKILSRITSPTSGRVEINGRVASLLEVGTGFHPELTGRENVFLNGAILGMTKSEIRRKFDEIVAFAEIDEFIDTPVKRYSSGMQVRLAFAVAAHLDPEILIIDEVLAVGDTSFQSKCLGKMGQVAASGRTIFFVSHNLHAIQSLCSAAIELACGKLKLAGSPADVIKAYLSESAGHTTSMRWNPGAAPGNRDIRLLAIAVQSRTGRADGSFQSDEDLLVTLDFEADRISPALCIGFDLHTPDGTCVLRTYQTDRPHELRPSISVGRNRLCCTIPRNLLNSGTHFVSPRIGIHNIEWIVYLDSVLRFDLEVRSSRLSRVAPGVVAPLFEWSELRESRPCFKLPASDLFNGETAEWHAT